MINSLKIYKKATKLVQKIGTIDALDIADELGIKLYYENFENMLGMYSYRWKHRFIFLNNNLDGSMLQMVLAHELGHDIFHRDLASNGLKEFALFDIRSITEYEANAFAAHVLLKNEDVLSLARAGYDVAQIASNLNSHINLLLIKMQEMNRMGFDFNVPYQTSGNFMGKIGT